MIESGTCTKKTFLYYTRAIMTKIVTDEMNVYATIARRARASRINGNGRSNSHLLVATYKYEYILVRVTLFEKYMGRGGTRVKCKMKRLCVRSSRSDLFVGTFIYRALNLCDNIRRTHTHDSRIKSPRSLRRLILPLSSAHLLRSSLRAKNTRDVLVATF